MGWWASWATPEIDNRISNQRGRRTNQTSNQRQRRRRLFIRETPLQDFALDGANLQNENYYVSVKSHLGCTLNLGELIPNAVYEPSKFSALTLQHRKCASKCLVFISGYLSCNAKTSKEARKSIRRYARMIQKNGYNCTLNFCLQVSLATPIVRTRNILCGMHQVW